MVADGESVVRSTLGDDNTFAYPYSEDVLNKRVKTFTETDRKDENDEKDIALISPDPMASNWGGPDYTSDLIKQGFYPVYTELEYQKSLDLIPNTQIIEKLLNYHKETNVTKLRIEQDQLAIGNLTSEQKILKDLFWIYTNIILNNILDEVKLKNPEIVVVDPTKKLKNETNNFFKDGLHLTSSGNEVVAESILKSIIENFDLKDFPS